MDKKPLRSPQKLAAAVHNKRLASLEILSTITRSVEQKTYKGKRLTATELETMARIKGLLYEYTQIGKPWAAIIERLPREAGQYLCVGYEKVGYDIGREIMKFHPETTPDKFDILLPPKATQLISLSQSQRLIEAWLSKDLIWFQTGFISNFQSFRLLVTLSEDYAARRDNIKGMPYADDPIFQQLTNSLIYSVSVLYASCKHDILARVHDEGLDSIQEFIDDIVKAKQFNIIDIQKKFFKSPVDTVFGLFMLERFGLIRSPKNWGLYKTLVKTRSEAMTILKHEQEKCNKMIEDIEKEVCG